MPSRVPSGAASLTSSAAASSAACNSFLTSRTLSFVFLALRSIGVHIKANQAAKILKEIDTDRSGEVDLEEFTAFFERVQSLNEVKDVVNRDNKTEQMKNKVMAIYMILILFFNFFNILNYLGVQQQRRKEGLVQSPEEMLQDYVTLALGLFLLFASFCYIIFMPILSMMFRQWAKPPMPAEGAAPGPDPDRAPPPVVEDDGNDGTVATET